MQIGAQTLILGMIALSLMLLAGYGGMVSLAQISVAGIAGYMVAIFGENTAPIGLGWPWWLVVPISLVLVATHCFGTLIGADLGAHRGHLHHHDHPGDRGRLL